MALPLLLSTTLVIARTFGNDDGAWNAGRLVRIYAVWQAEIWQVSRGMRPLDPTQVRAIAEEALGLELLLQQLLQKAKSAGPLRMLLRDHRQLRENLVLRCLSAAESFADAWQLERLQRKLETVLQDAQTVPRDLAISLLGLTVSRAAEEAGSAVGGAVSLREQLLEQLCSAALESVPREQFSGWGSLMSPQLQRLCRPVTDRPLAAVSLLRL